MNQLLEAFSWIGDPSNWTGPSGMLARSREHLGYTLLTLLIAAAIAVPIGWWVGHTGRGRGSPWLWPVPHVPCPPSAWSP